MFTMSGTTLKIAAGIEHWSGGSLLVAMLIVWAIGVIMGLVGVGLVAYLIVSLFAVSMLMKMGLTMETAHFFILYSSAFGFITPPVAIGAIIASKLANANYTLTAIEGTKVGIGGFLIPWMFVFTPMMLLAPGSFEWGGMIGVITAILIMVALQIGFVGYLFTDCSGLERWMAVASACFMLVSKFLQSDMLLVIGLILFAVTVIWQFSRHRLSKTVGQIG
jgi:TRAP-type uncharacterized transport system fused permease subunit